jgi:3'-5' exonuclease
MFSQLDLSKCIFIDIETVPEHTAYDQLSENWQALWKEKWIKTRPNRYRNIFPDREMPTLSAADLDKEAEASYTEAGLYAEFGKICCVSLGRFKEYDPKDSKPNRHFFVTSLYGNSEQELLQMLERIFSKSYSEKRKGGFVEDKRLMFDYNYCLVGHNIKEFDIPYLCRRMLVNEITLPPLIDCTGLKPWEIKHLVDTLELWKFGDIKNFTSLKILAERFRIPSPKEDMDGGGVYKAYLNNELDAVAKYCARDVVAVAQLLLRWRQEPILEEDEIEVRLEHVSAQPLIA